MDPEEHNSMERPIFHRPDDNPVPLNQPEGSSDVPKIPQPETPPISNEDQTFISYVDLGIPLTENQAKRLIDLHAAGSVPAEVLARAGITSSEEDFSQRAPGTREENAADDEVNPRAHDFNWDNVEPDPSVFEAQTSLPSQSESYTPMSDDEVKKARAKIDALSSKQPETPLDDDVVEGEFTEIEEDSSNQINVNPVPQPSGFGGMAGNGGGMGRPEDMDLPGGQGRRARSERQAPQQGGREPQPQQQHQEQESGHINYLEGLSSNLDIEQQVRQIRALCQDIQYTYPEAPLRQISQYDNQLSQQVGKLEKMIRQYESRGYREIALEALVEAKVFFNLHDSLAMVSTADMKAENVRRSMGDGFKTLENTKRALDGPQLAALLKGKIEGDRKYEGNFFQDVPVGYAYVVLQEVATHGVTYHVDGQEDKIIRSGDKLSTQEADFLTAHIHRKLQGNSAINPNNAKNSDDSAWALELGRMYNRWEYMTSVLNTEGKDPVAKAIYLQQAREATIGNKQKGTTGDDYGPWYTVDAIPALGSNATSLLRYLSIEENGVKRKLVENDRWQAAYATATGDGIVEDLLRLMRVNPYDKADAVIVDPRTLPLEKVQLSEIKDYYTKVIPALVETTEWALKSDWKLGELRKDQLETLKANLRLIDPNDSFHIAPLLITGILVESQESFNPNMETKGTFMDPYAVRNFLDMLKREPNPFLPAKHVAAIENMEVEQLDGTKRKLDPVGYAHNISLKNRIFQPVRRTTQ